MKLFIPFFPNLERAFVFLPCELIFSQREKRLLSRHQAAHYLFPLPFLQSCDPAVYSGASCQGKFLVPSFANLNLRIPPTTLPPVFTL